MRYLEHTTTRTRALGLANGVRLRLCLRTLAQASSHGARERP
jgi:hypothetical protein